MCCRDGGTKERKVEKVEGEGLCRHTAQTASEKQKDGKRDPRGEGVDKRQTGS